MSTNTPNDIQTEANVTVQVEGSNRDDDQPAEKPLAGTILVVVGFALGGFILLFDYFPLNDPYLKTTPFQLYALAVISQTVFWAVAVGSMWRSSKSLLGLFEDHKTEVILWCILFLILLYSSKYFAVSCPVYSFRHHGLKTNLLTFFGGTVAIMAGIVSILVNIGLRELLTSRSQAEAIEKENADSQLVTRYLQLRSCLLHSLSVVGIMLGLVAVAQSAKRYMILEHVQAFDATAACKTLILPGEEMTKCIQQGFYCESMFDLKKVFVYGLYYTMILVLTFLPTFSILIATGHKLRDDILPLPSPRSDSWSSACAKRAKLEKLLALSFTESFRAIVAVLAPLIGSLISLLGLLKK